MEFTDFTFTMSLHSSLKSFYNSWEGGRRKVLVMGLQFNQIGGWMGRRREVGGVGREGWKEGREGERRRKEEGCWLWLYN